MSIKDIATKDDFFNELRNQPSEVKKQEFIENLLKVNMRGDVRIAALSLLAEFYIKRGWFGLAARQYTNAADLSNTFNEKIDYYFRAGSLYLTGAEFMDADNSFKKVVVLSATKDKERMKNNIISLYRQNVENYERTRQYTKAIAMLNRMFFFNLPVQESNVLYDRLASLYDRVGQPVEANRVRNLKARETERQKGKQFPFED